MKALVIPADRESQMYVKETTKEEYSKWLRATVDGYVEVLYSDPNMVMYGNEEARLDARPANWRVNELLGDPAHEYVGRTTISQMDENFQPVGDPDVIHDTSGVTGYALGDVIIVGPLDEDGEDTDLSDNVISIMSVALNESIVRGGPR